MGAQFLYNFFHISQLLWGKEGVIQQPVIVLPILVLGTKQVDRSIQKFQISYILYLTPAGKSIYPTYRRGLYGSEWLYRAGRIILLKRISHAL